jgi:outer membrane protein OmpA-like peptidoglycan-associated protein
LTLRGCLLVAAALMAAACASARAPRTSAPDPEAGGKALVVLLADPGTDTVGRAVVSNAHGAVDLDMAREATRVSSNAAPSPPEILSEGEVRELFGLALEGMPPAPEHFTLYFKFESEELTDESRRMLQDVLQAVKARPVPDVVAVGHTDTTGQPRANVQLGLRRAVAVRTLLVSAGLTRKAIEVTSHGEAELLVKTSDGVFEPRNRRVEITVR